MYVVKRVSIILSTTGKNFHTCTCAIAILPRVHLSCMHGKKCAEIEKPTCSAPLYNHLLLNETGFPHPRRALIVGK